jgi:hypothetical protein
VVHPYIKLNLDHLKTTKIRTNIHMTNESKNLESGALACLTTIKFLCFDHNIFTIATCFALGRFYCSLFAKMELELLSLHCCCCRSS